MSEFVHWTSTLPWLLSLSASAWHTCVRPPSPAIGEQSIKAPRASSSLNKTLHICDNSKTSYCCIASEACALRSSLFSKFHFHAGWLFVICLRGTTFGEFHLLRVYSRLRPHRNERLTTCKVFSRLPTIILNNKDIFVAFHSNLPYTASYIMEQPTNTTDVKGLKQMVPEGMPPHVELTACETC
jgi:hypothetical protein